MPQLIQPHLVKVMTKDGECLVHITLDLNINLNSGELNVVARQTVAKESEEQTEEEKTHWAIPTFTSGNKVKFGKKE